MLLKLILSCFRLMLYDVKNYNDAISTADSYELAKAVHFTDA